MIVLPLKNRLFTRRWLHWQYKQATTNARKSDRIVSIFLKLHSLRDCLLLADSCVLAALCQLDGPAVRLWSAARWWTLWHQSWIQLSGSMVVSVVSATILFLLHSRRTFFNFFQSFMTAISFTTVLLQLHYNSILYCVAWPLSWRW